LQPLIQIVRGLIQGIPLFRRAIHSQWTAKNLDIDGFCRHATFLLFDCATSTARTGAREGATL